MSRKFEYDIHFYDTFGVNGETADQSKEKAIAKLNKLGDVGWEMVSACVHPGSHATKMFVFKRPKRSASNKKKRTSP